MELSAFLGKKVIIYAPLKYGHFVFFFATLIQQGSTCTQSGWRWVQRPFGPVSLITVIHTSLHCFDSGVLRDLWYDDSSMWPLLHFSFSNKLLKFTLLLEHHYWHNSALYSGSTGACISLTSPSFSGVIKSCKWQFLVRSRIHRGGAACWPSLPLPQQLLIGKTRSSPSGQWLTKWWISSSILACWSIVVPPSAPSNRVDIGICHSSGCAPESRNCWLVKWVPACGIFNV